MTKFTVTEPHPTVVKNQITHSGRGGAGNHFRAPSTTPATGVPTVTKPMPPSSASFYSGRGGAGNAHSSQSRPVMSLEDEYDHQAHVEQKPMGYVGRGGAGNAYGVKPRKDSDACSRRSSNSSGSSTRSMGFMHRLSTIASRH